MTPARRNLDPVLHNEARIAIVTRLLLFDVLRFSRLKDLTGLTAGNLATHLDALEKVAYVEQRDAIVNRRPGKLVRLTDQGRTAFHSYLQGLEALVAELRQVPPAAKDSSPSPAIPAP